MCRRATFKSGSPTYQESDSANTAASSSSTEDARGAPSGTSRSRGTPRAVISTDGAGVAEPSVARATASSAGARKRRRSSAFADEAPVPLRNASRLSRGLFAAANRSARRARARRAARRRRAPRRLRQARRVARGKRLRHAPKRRTKGFSVRIAISPAPRERKLAAPMARCVSAISISRTRAFRSMAEPHVSQCA